VDRVRRPEQLADRPQAVSISAPPVHEDDVGGCRVS
jgi:hypothetical protein